MNEDLMMKTVSNGNTYEFSAINYFNPTIFMVSNLFSPEECERALIEIEDNAAWRKGAVLEKGSEEAHPGRTNHISGYGYHGWADTFRARACAVTRMEKFQAEGLQLVKYNEGEFYDGHMDAFNPESNDPFFKQAGNRILTGLLYLNDDFEGGNTTFKHVGKSIKPKQGTAIFFENTNPSQAFPNPHSLHSADVVTSGEKIAANIWFRAGPYDLDMFKQHLGAWYNTGNVPLQWQKYLPKQEISER